MSPLAATTVSINHLSSPANGIINDDTYRNKIAFKVSSIIRLHIRSKKARRSYFYEDGDLIQEVWIRLLSNNRKILRQYNTARGTSFEQYISMIAKREIGNLLRKEIADKRSSHLTVELKENTETKLSPDTFDRKIVSRDLANKLNRWLHSKLSEHGIDILNATFRDGLDAPTAAKHLGVSIQNIYNWQHKIRTLSRIFMIEFIGPHNAAG